MFLNYRCGVSKSSLLQKWVRIILLFLIIIGVGLLATQKLWVPKLVTFILADELSTLATQSEIATSSFSGNSNHTNVSEPKPLPGDVDQPKEVPVIVPVAEEGNVILSLGEISHFGTFTIRPLEIKEDSRCPKDVTCIQAGTVRLSMQIVSAQGTSTSIVKLDEVLEVEGAGVTFLSVTPENSVKEPLNASDYRFNFKVVPQALPLTPITKNTCYVGGCSSQLCTDTTDVMSTCEYREEYMCYQTAECKRQPSGQCGFTETNELRSCLNNKTSSVY